MMKTSISPVAIGVVIAGIVFSIWPLIHRLNIESRAEFFRKYPFKDTKFKISRFAYVWPCLGILFGMYFFNSAQSWPHGRILLIVGGITTICFSLLLARVYSTSSITFSNDWVVVREGRKEQKFQLNDIESISFIQWYVPSAVVKMKSGGRINIMLQYEDNPMLLAMIKFYRPNCCA
ncbi:MAG: hypothetical protein HZA89_06460 [Verrucomicrobia bacterium]|nr:hypothetical protein [Verrucomicrobiota bacterium]